MAKVINIGPYHQHHLTWSDAAGGPCDHCGIYVADGDGIMASTYPAASLAIFDRFFSTQGVTLEEIEDGGQDDGRYCSDECLLCDLLPPGYEYVDGQVKEETNNGE